MLDLVANLNEAQRAAVIHLDGPLMIIAGAGTGKTRVITHRIAFLSREVGIPLNQILAVTFTNKAAREMRERVCHILGVPDTPGLSIGTFHARCAVLLRREAAAASLDPNFAILDESDQKQAIKRVLKEMKISDKRVTPGQVQSFINQAKMRLLTPADCAEDFDDMGVPYPDIYAAYQKVLEASKGLDFEDLMMRTVALLRDDEAARLRWSQRYKYVLVDEYQDTNHAQFQLTKLLAHDHGQVCIVGDEDQSIYSWRGAEISNLLDFQKHFPAASVVKLEHNYRSTGNILRAASTVIARNTQRIGKTLFTTEPEGPKLRFMASRDQDDEGMKIAQDCAGKIAQGDSPDSIAIFYRSHWVARAMEDALRRARLPYRVVGGLRFYDRAEIKDLLGFLRLAVIPDDDLAFERVANRPTRGAGDKTIQDIAAHAAAQGKSLYRATLGMLFAGEIKGKARTGLESFTDAISRWNRMAKDAAAIDVFKQVLIDTRYIEEGLGDASSLEAETKVENIKEFESLVENFKAEGEEFQLAEFLTSMSLDSTDSRDDGRPKINLLTIHNAKGLEFPHVYIMGLEKGIFPTSRAEESREEYAIEEERRLFYVAITRARRQLTMCFAKQRNRPDFWGTFLEPSMFLRELPPDVFDPNSADILKRLLPYGWGQEKAQGGSKPAGGERTFVPDPDADPRPTAARLGPARPRYSVGQRVTHKYLGHGQIVELGGRPGWERATIEFEDGRSQEFVLKYAPLTIEE